MKEFQKRVIAEKEELDGRLEKLVAFIRGNDYKEFEKLPVDEQRRLRRQQYCMELYSEVLGQRIEAFGK